MMDPPVVPEASTSETSTPPPAFRTIYDAHCGYVWNTLRRLGVRERDLEDLVHEVFMIVHKRLGDYDPARPPRPWLFGISVRVASDYRARAGHQREVVEEELEMIDPAPAADEQMEAAQRRALVTAALNRIELGKRAVLIMHEIDGCPVPEVASALGIPLNTAYSRLRHAREEFAQAVRRLSAQKGGRT